MRPLQRGRGSSDADASTDAIADSAAHAVADPDALSLAEAHALLVDSPLQ